MDLPSHSAIPLASIPHRFDFLPVEDYAPSDLFETIGIESNNVDNHDWRYFQR